MGRVVMLAALALAVLTFAGCANRYPMLQARELAPAYETGWDRPDATGTNLYKPALSRGTGIVGLWP